MSAETAFDVVVVGGGGSGLASAIEARALGASVVLLEKNPQLGGSTAWSIGSVTATGTPHQARAVFVHAEGGLAVDTEHCVLGKDDKPIEGLYAAGSTGQGGLLLKGHGHHLGWAFASGRRAGRNAATKTSGA